MCICVCIIIPAELDCQTGLACTNGVCSRNPTNGDEYCVCNKGYQLSDSDDTLCVGKLGTY